MGLLVEAERVELLQSLPVEDPRIVSSEQDLAAATRTVRKGIERGLPDGVDRLARMTGADG
jgi:hypothetical protein